MASRSRGFARELSIRRHIRNGVPSGSWQVDIPAKLSEDGARRRITFGTRHEAEAFAKSYKRRLEVRSAVAGPSERLSGLTFSEVCAQWWDEQITAVRAGLKQRSTLETNSYQLKPVLQFFGRADLSEITRTMVMGYQSQRRERDEVSPDTINSETARLRQVLAWANGQGLCAAPPKFQTLKVRQRQPVLPTPEEIAALIEHLPFGPAIVVRLLFETGCRPSEILGLETSDVDYSRARVRLQPNEARSLKNSVSERSVPISRDLADDLRQLSPTGAKLLSGIKGIAKKALQRALNSAVIAADIRRHGELIELTPKVFRKVNGTLLAMQGVPEASLQTRFGHARGSRTLRKYYVWAEQLDEEQPVITLPKAAK